MAYAGHATCIQTRANLRELVKALIGGAFAAAAIADTYVLHHPLHHPSSKSGMDFAAEANA
jgi:hypothetical protein